MKPSKQRDVLYAQRLAISTTELDATGDAPFGPSTAQSSIFTVIGTPDGRALGKSGDIAIRLDVPQVWLKGTLGEERTKNGWVLIAAATSSVAVMQELLLDVSGIAMQPNTPVEGQENVTVPPGFVAADRASDPTSGHVVLVYGDSTEDEIAAVWQLALPANYNGNGLQLVVEFAGQAGQAAAVASMFALIQRNEAGSTVSNATFGSEIDLSTVLDSVLTIVQTTVTISGAQLDGLQAGEAFRILIGRHQDDAFDGNALFVRGRIRGIA